MANVKYIQLNVQALRTLRDYIPGTDGPQVTLRKALQEAIDKAIAIGVDRVSVCLANGVIRTK
jgi:hypothetical protein